MAEIELQKKKKPIWPWILGIILAALLVWALIAYLDNDNDDVDNTATPVMQDTVAENNETQNVAATGAVAAFVTWANSDDNAEMGVHHDYTANGLRKLSAAIEELASRKYTGDADVSNTVNELKTSSNAIQEDWKSEDHANEIKSAFLAATNALDKMQQKSNAGMNSKMESLRAKANSIDKQTLTLNQKGPVKDFFKEAGEVIQQIDKQ